MNTLKSCLIPVKQLKIKRSGILFRGSIHLTLKNVLGGDNKRSMERKQGKQYIIYKWSHAKNWKPKGYEESKLLRKQCVWKQSAESYEYKIAKSSSPSVSWKLNTSLTQKDTMDRGAWIKNFLERRYAGGLNKGQKSKSTKVQNGMGMRNKRIFLLPYVTILWCLSW